MTSIALFFKKNESFCNLFVVGLMLLKSQVWQIIKRKENSSLKQYETIKQIASSNGHQKAALQQQIDHNLLSL